MALTTIDDVVGTLGLDRLDFIKADIEGWELRLLHGAESTLESFRPRLLLELTSAALARRGSARGRLRLSGGPGISSLSLRAADESRADCCACRRRFLVHTSRRSGLLNIERRSCSIPSGIFRRLGLTRSGTVPHIGRQRADHLRDRAHCVDRHYRRRRQRQPSVVIGRRVAPLQTTVYSRQRSDTRSERDDGRAAQTFWLGPRR